MFSKARQYLKKKLKNKIAKQLFSYGLIYCILSLTQENSLIIHPILNNINETKQEFDFNEIKFIFKYRYMFKQIAIAVWFHNNRHSSLIIFEDERSRNLAYNYLKNNCKKMQDSHIHINNIKHLWVNGQISNYNYLMFLNAMGNRNFNDLSQYPIFPWVISEYGVKSKKNNFILIHVKRF